MKKVTKFEQALERLNQEIDFVQVIKTRRVYAFWL
jgi:hypothetical protein